MVTKIYAGDMRVRYQSVSQYNAPFSRFTFIQWLFEAIQNGHIGSITIMQQPCWRS